MNDDSPAFLAFRYSEGTWTVIVVSKDRICEVEDMTAAKLIEIIETLESLNETGEKNWCEVFH